MSYSNTDGLNAPASPQPARHLSRQVTAERRGGLPVRQPANSLSTITVTVARLAQRSDPANDGKPIREQIAGYHLADRDTQVNGVHA